MENKVDESVVFELVEQKKLIHGLQLQNKTLLETITKLSDRFSGMSKFLIDSNKDLSSKIEAKNKEALHQMPMSSPEQNELFAALCKAKADLPIEMDRSGNTNRGSFASFSDLVDHAKEILAHEGIDILFEPITLENRDYLKTTITHSSGQWRTSVTGINPEYGKGGLSEVQAYACALTSMKRYIYAAILNLHSGGEK